TCCERSSACATRTINQDGKKACCGLSMCSSTACARSRPSDQEQAAIKHPDSAGAALGRAIWLVRLSPNKEKPRQKDAGDEQHPNLHVNVEHRNVGDQPLRHEASSNGRALFMLEKGESIRAVGPLDVIGSTGAQE